MFKKSHLFICIIVGLIILSISGCGKRPDPQETVKSYLDNLKNGKLIESEKYVYMGEDSKDEKSKDDKTKDDNQTALQPWLKPFYSKMTYEIIETTTDKDIATSKITLTLPDMQSVYSEILSQRMTQALELFKEQKENKDDTEKKEVTVPSDSPEETNNKIKEILETDKMKLTTSEATLKLVYSNNKWLIEFDKDSINKLTGNYYNLINAFGTDIKDTKDTESEK